MHFNISKAQTKVFFILIALQYYNVICFFGHFIKSKYITDSGKKFELNSHFHINQCLQIDENKGGDLDTHGYYDTLTDEDIVWKQYSLLPYPPISKEALEVEEAYYKGIEMCTIDNITSTKTSLSSFTG